MLIEYKAPNGSTWQFEQGEQPRDYTEVKARKTPANKSRTSPRNKGARAPRGKGA